MRMGGTRRATSTWNFGIHFRESHMTLIFIFHLTVIKRSIVPARVCSYFKFIKIGHERTWLWAVTPTNQIRSLRQFLDDNKWPDPLVKDFWIFYWCWNSLCEPNAIIHLKKRIMCRYVIVWLLMPSQCPEVFCCVILCFANTLVSFYLKILTRWRHVF